MQILLEDGTPAVVTLYSGERVLVRSPRAAAPGEPVRARLHSGTSFRFKVGRCARDGDAFLIEARLLDASKALLRELQGPEAES